MIEIKYHRDVLLFLDELTDILIEKGYFSFYEYSAKYIPIIMLRGNFLNKIPSLKRQLPNPYRFILLNNVLRLIFKAKAVSVRL